MSRTSPTTFTLLCASKNEEKDIRVTLETALAQTYPHKEIIFVDDSTDRTKDIIREYKGKGVILIDGEGKGCCQARNLGLRRATGDVIVFLTADTKLEPGYLEKILPYYEKGYDCVMVESFSNLDTVYSRFVQVQHLIVASQANYNPLTTQGYSVRREAALAVGGISGGNYPVNFCRDWTLVKKMDEKGYKKIIDRSIIVGHISPDNFREYWQVQKTRGLWSAYQPYFLFFRSPLYLFFKFTVKCALTFFHFALIVPAFWYTGKIASYSKHPARDYFPLYYAYFLHRLARCVGEWQGWWYVWKYDKTHERPLLGGALDSA
jgi:glycosyltransferase involved in cell wall biosynthesis